MKKVRALVLFQWKSVIRQPAIWLVLLALPLLSSFFLKQALEPLFAKDAHVDPFSVAVVDLDGSFETRAMIHQLTSSPEFRQVVDFLYVEKDEGFKLITDDQVAAIVIIPERFSEDVRFGKNTPIEVVGNPQRPLQYQLFLAVMNGAADLITAAQSAVNTVYSFLRDEVDRGTLQQEVDRAILDFSLQSLGRNHIFKTTLLSETGSFSLEEYFIASLLVLVPFLIGIVLMPVLRQEFSDKVEKRLRTFNLTLTQKLVSSFVTTFSFLAISLVLFVVMVDVTVTGKLLLFLVVLLLIIALVASFYLFTSSFRLPPFAESVVISGSLVFLAIVSGCILPLSFYPDWVASIGVYSPMYWGREAVLYSAFVFDSQKLLMSVAVITGFLLFFLLVSYFIEARKGW